MSDTYVLVHGAWHTGAELEATATHIRTLGHTVHCPTLAGNRPGDDRSRIGLAEAAESLCEFLREHDLRDVRLVGHSYGGMVISKAADVMPERIRRLVYAGPRPIRLRSNVACFDVGVFQPRSPRCQHPFTSLKQRS